MRIAIALFEGVTALDAIGPYEVLQRLPGSVVRFVGHRVGEVRTDNGFLGLTVDATFDELEEPDILLVPGGIGTRALVHDATILDWIRTAHETSRYTTSVCTGSLLLAAAGLLDGLSATTHFSAQALARQVWGDTLERSRGPRRQGHHRRRRVERHRHGPTSRRASSPTTTTAKALQLMIEYDPQAPT